VYSAWGKRAFDVLAAMALLVLAAPVMGVVALLVWRDLGRPVLFRQRRAGRDGIAFELLKFRTMRDGDGEDAARLTRMGRVLRATALDEVPQLWHVLRGQMSLVGPRPLLPEYAAHYTPREATRLNVRPGLCGLAQAQGRNAVPWPARLEWDARYVERVTLVEDLRIIWRCLWVVLRGQGVHAPGEATMTPLSASREGP